MAGFGQGWRVGEVGGVELRLDPSMFVILALLGYQPGLSAGDTMTQILLWVMVAGFAILIHELGHAVAFRAFGHRASVLLYGMGGLTSASGTARFEPWKQLLTSLAGPLAGFGLGGLVLLTGRPDGGLAEDAWIMALVACFGFGVLNLLPILPLDGGQSMLAILRTVRVPSAERLGHQISIGVAGVGALLGLRFGGFFIALIGLLFAGQNWAALREIRERPMVDRLRGAMAALVDGRYDEAAAAADSVLSEQAGKPNIQHADVAAETLAWAALGRGDVAGARAALQRRPPIAGPRLVDAGVAISEGAGAEAAGVAALALNAGDWGPPRLLLALIDRPDIRPWVEAKLTDEGRALLARIRQAVA